MTTTRGVSVEDLYQEVAEYEADNVSVKSVDTYILMQAAKYRNGKSHERNYSLK